MWSTTGAVAAWFDQFEVWRTWADDVTDDPIAAGHLLPEAAPDETTRHLFDFLA
jgi:haloacetate dehalogenase